MGYKVILNGRPLESLSAKETKAYHDANARRLKEMLESGQPPRADTDTSLNAAWDNTNGKQFADQPQYGDMALKRAKAAGVSTNGKMYLSGLADSAGDPKAWVEGKADIRRIAEEKGMGVEGAVTVKMRDAPRHTIDNTTE